ncbi:MAG TPA: hydrogenase maturation nickel metallochaperone HypA [Burkholderiaceae bacterium]|nr:hydrogenase maturation nickel metallochaperone HypA [Burkholderiaceae bacterium]
MHELSITRSVVALCAERANGARVQRVTLVIGQLSGVMADAVRFCFDICARGTPVEGASLEIIETPGRARCLDCGGEIELPMLAMRCLCGSANLQLLSGDELKVREMEVV